jgi:hypothetical protein
LISHKHRNKLRADFFKQKCKTLINKKMEFLLNHKNQSANKKKRVIRFNINKKNNCIYDELLGNDKFATIVKKPKKKLKSVKRSVSTNVDYKINSYITSLTTNKFSKVKIVSKNSYNRKTSCCNENGNVKIDLMDNKFCMTNTRADNLDIIRRGLSKRHTSSVNESEAAATHVSVLDIRNDSYKPSKVYESENVFNLPFKSYVTPIKKKRRIYAIDSTSSKCVETTPMMIRSMNTSTQKTYDSSQKTWESSQMTYECGKRSQRDLPYTTSEPTCYSQTYVKSRKVKLKKK